jgi:hypothetical protein
VVVQLPPSKTKEVSGFSEIKNNDWVSQEQAQQIYQFLIDHKPIIAFSTGVGVIFLYSLAVRGAPMNTAELNLGMKKCEEYGEAVNAVYVKVTELGNLCKANQANCKGLASETERLYDYQVHFSRLRKIEEMEEVSLEASLLQAQTNKNFNQNKSFEDQAVLLKDKAATEIEKVVDIFNEMSRVPNTCLAVEEPLLKTEVIVKNCSQLGIKISIELDNIILLTESAGRWSQ